MDHGKSTLIAALTGTHPDRLKEEQTREMTIDLGFGWMTLPNSEEVGIVDVPGHRDFIENMLAGIGGIDAALLVIASVHLGWQAWRAAVTYAADPRNPYVYAQTVPDAVRMAARIRDLAALHPDGARMQVSVIAPAYEQWPLPWYLRTMPNVGYWAVPGDALALQAPVIVSSMEHTPVLDGTLGDRYVPEFFGLRPDVLLTLYVERGLWERFLATRQ